MRFNRNYFEQFLRRKSPGPELRAFQSVVVFYFWVPDVERSTVKQGLCAINEHKPLPKKSFMRGKLFFLI